MLFVYAAREGHYRELSNKNKLRPQDVMRILVHYHAYGAAAKATKLVKQHSTRLQSIVTAQEAEDVARLTAEGLGLEGVRRVIELENQVDALKRTVVELQAELDAAHVAMGSVRNLPARLGDAHLVVWRRPKR